MIAVVMSFERRMKENHSNRAAKRSMNYAHYVFILIPYLLSLRIRGYAHSVISSFFWLDNPSGA